jgi:hypothetical protein
MKAPKYHVVERRSVYVDNRMPVEAYVIRLRELADGLIEAHMDFNTYGDDPEIEGYRPMTTAEVNRAKKQEVKRAERTVKERAAREEKELALLDRLQKKYCLP